MAPENKELKQSSLFEARLRFNAFLDDDGTTISRKGDRSQTVALFDARLDWFRDEETWISRRGEQLRIGLELHGRTGIKLHGFGLSRLFNMSDISLCFFSDAT